MRPRPRRPLQSALTALNANAPQCSTPISKRKDEDIPSLPASSDSDAFKLLSDVLPGTTGSDEDRKDTTDDPFGFLAAERMLKSNKPRRELPRQVSPGHRSGPDDKSEVDDIRSENAVAFATPEKETQMSSAYEEGALSEHSASSGHRTSKQTRREVGTASIDKVYDVVPATSSPSKPITTSKSSKAPKKRDSNRTRKTTRRKANMAEVEQAEEELAAVNAELVEALPTRPQRRREAARVSSSRTAMKPKKLARRKQNKITKSKGKGKANGEDEEGDVDASDKVRCDENVSCFSSLLTCQSG